MLLAVGIGFCTETVTIPLLVCIIMALLYGSQIKREERLLAKSFGKEFQAYMASTPRFFPLFKHYCEPESICISPRPLMKGLFGIIFLLMLIALVQLLGTLHDANLLPTYFHIY
jgi:hypothetical protein